jgi:hypothetical protein
MTFYQVEALLSSESAARHTVVLIGPTERCAANVTSVIGPAASTPLCGWPGDTRLLAVDPGHVLWNDSGESTPNSADRLCHNYFDLLAPPGRLFEDGFLVDGDVGALAAGTALEANDALC